MTREIEHSLLVRLNDHLADHIGLSFARDRLSDFKRRVVAAAKEFGMEPVDCVNWLLSAPLTKEQIHTLSYHLTIGETYFFRDPKAFEILEDQILAALIRQGATRAGSCASGAPGAAQAKSLTPSPSC
jgi:chemotaxis protein methyltransferase CheR